ncbi:TPA: hypothetical protein ACX37Z_000345, partial [Serratia marcescens]
INLIIYINKRIANASLPACLAVDGRRKHKCTFDFTRKTRPHLSANEWAETGIRQTQHEALLKAMNFSRRKANK